jgi:hypothetical protein
MDRISNHLLFCIYHRSSEVSEPEERLSVYSSLQVSQSATLVRLREQWTCVAGMAPPHHLSSRKVQAWQDDTTAIHTAWDKVCMHLC